MEDKINKEGVYKSTKVVVFVGASLILLPMLIMWIRAELNRALSEPDCGIYYDILEMELEGRITKKGRDNENHAINTLWIYDKNQKSPVKYYFYSSREPIYDSCRKGDYIKKEKGKLTFIINGDAYDLYEFECTEESFYIGDFF